MKVFFEFAILGLGLAGGYALATLGIVLIYRGSGVVNFAQGGFALVGAYVYYETGTSIPKWASCLCGIAAAAVFLAPFSLRPRNSRPPQIRARTSGAFSPMPPAKTSVSNPPSVPAMPQIHFLA